MEIFTLQPIMEIFSSREAHQWPHDMLDPTAACRELNQCIAQVRAGTYADLQSHPRLCIRAAAPPEYEAERPGNLLAIRKWSLGAVGSLNQLVRSDPDATTFEATRHGKAAFEVHLTGRVDGRWLTKRTLVSYPTDIDGRMCLLLDATYEADFMDDGDLVFSCDD
jgi:hypothetical protein